MAELTLKSGRCLCGEVRFSAKVVADVDACHCGMCRRWTGGVFMGVHAEDVVAEDEGALGVFRSSDYGERVFCRTCGSSLFWRMQDGSSAHVAVSALDDMSGLNFAREIFIDAKPAFYDFANSTRRMTGAEFVAMFEDGGGQ